MMNEVTQGNPESSSWHRSCEPPGLAKAYLIKFPNRSASCPRAETYIFTEFSKIEKEYEVNIDSE